MICGEAKWRQAAICLDFDGLGSYIETGAQRTFRESKENVLSLSDHWLCLRENHTQRHFIVARIRLWEEAAQY